MLIALLIVQTPFATSSAFGLKRWITKAWVVKLIKARCYKTRTYGHA